MAIVPTLLIYLLLNTWSFIQKLTINYSCYYDLINLNNLDNLDMRTKNCNLQNPFWNFYLWGRRYFIPFGVTPKLIYISFTKLWSTILNDSIDFICLLFYIVHCLISLLIAYLFHYIFAFHYYFYSNYRLKYSLLF